MSFICLENNDFLILALPPTPFSWEIPIEFAIVEL